MIPMDSFTDLLGGLILIPMVLALCLKKTAKKQEKQYWVLFMILLSVSCLVGFVAHYYCRTEWSFHLIWMPLYAAMYETVNIFFLLALYRVTDGARPTPKETVCLHVISLVAWLPTVLMELFAADLFNPILIFLIVALLEALIAYGFVIVAAFRQKKKSAIVLLTALLPLLVGEYFQFDRNIVWHWVWDFNSNAITHLFIILSMFILFAAAEIELSAEKTDQVTIS